MVARRLAPLNIRFVFVGGVVMPLLVDQPELAEFRPTKDIDVIVEIVTYQQFSALEERLRVSGFCHDTSEGAPNSSPQGRRFVKDEARRETTLKPFREVWRPLA